jgi:predicted transglutaminase-like cysteine proteinase
MLVAAPTWAAGLFGMMEIKGNSIASFTKWVDVLGRIRLENGVLEACEADESRCPNGRGRGWKQMMAAAQGMDRAGQMRAVNHYFNTFPYIEDINNYGKTDYWASPLQMMKNSGDCEDYAISKFVSLRMLGWDNDDLRIVIVRDKVRDINHAVLAADAGGGEMILDNLASQPLPSRTVIQYSPYYAVNETSRWIFMSSGQ